MAADRQRPVGPSGRRSDELHALPVGQHGREQRPLAADPAGPSVPKIRSRAVNTRIGSPCRTLIVGPRLPSCWAATEAALCPAPPTITVEAPPVTSEPAPPRIESRIAEPNREKKWLL